jgi:pyruvate/2-oxoglutarate dehydrogenase complex dihydrolipoamide acyltransferase (E2) component
MTDVTIPADLWDGDLEASISAWFYEDGDEVAANAVIAEIMVEKTSYELLAPVAGTLRRLVAEEEPIVRGQRVAHID